jgi:hypothetical protein
VLTAFVAGTDSSHALSASPLAPALDGVVSRLQSSVKPPPTGSLPRDLPTPDALAENEESALHFVAVGADQGEAARTSTHQLARQEHAWNARHEFRLALRNAAEQLAAAAVSVDSRNAIPLAVLVELRKRMCALCVWSAQISRSFSPAAARAERFSALPVAVIDLAATLVLRALEDVELRDWLSADCGAELEELVLLATLTRALIGDYPDHLTSAANAALRENTGLRLAFLNADEWRALVGKRHEPFARSDRSMP